MIFDGIFYFIFQAFWTPVRLCLLFFHWIQEIFIGVSNELPFYVLFGVKSENLLSGGVSVPPLFLRFIFTSFILLFIFLIFQAIKGYKKENPEPFVNMWKNAFKHYLFFLFFVWILALFMFGLKWLILVMYDGDTLAIDQEIFKAIKPEEIDDSYWENVIENGYSIDFDTYTLIKSGTSLVLVSYIGVIVPTILFAFTLLSVIIKCFEILYMFILSPWIHAYSIIDNGKVMKKWWAMFFSKFMTIILYPVVIQIYVFFINRTLSYWDTNDGGTISHTFMKIIILIAATLSINGAGIITTAFFGDNLSAREGIQQISQIRQLGAATMGAGALAYGIAKKTGVGVLKAKSGVGMAARGGANLVRNFGSVSQGVKGALSKFGEASKNIQSLDMNKNIGMAARLHKESGRRLFKDLKQTFSTPFKDANQKFAKRQETSSKLLNKLNQMKDNLKN